MWWKKNKWKVFTPVLIVAVLVASFWYGGDAPGLQGWNPQPSDDAAVAAMDTGASAAQAQPDTPSAAELVPAPAPAAAPAAETSPEPTVVGTTTPDAETTPEPAEKTEVRSGGSGGGWSATDKLAAAAEIAGGSSPGVQSGDEGYSETQGMVIDPNTGKDRYLTDPVPEGKPIPVEPDNAVVTDTQYTCTLSISCATINDNIGWLDPEKVELVPEDGWILPATTVTFYEGESVFNVLLRTCKQLGIHMEFENTPVYNSAYIEGIHNLYEFDCGELSGWMYQVNDWFPNYGCSRYQLQDGDIVNWVYTCNLGIDVGGYYAIG